MKVIYSTLGREGTRREHGVARDEGGPGSGEREAGRASEAGTGEVT